MMRILAIAASAATFWLLVATVSLILHGESRHAAAIATGPAPQPVVETVPAPPPPEPNRCGIEGWPDVPRPGGLTFRDVRCGIDGARPRLWACQRQFPDESFHAVIDVVIGRSGRVSSARFRGGRPHTRLAGCIEEAMASVRYPRSTGRYSFPLAWYGME